MKTILVENALFWCGIAHFGLSLGSLYIPHALRWKTHLSHLQPLLRQMFWTYAGYILAINVAFGLISTGGTSELVSGSFLARSVTLLIGLYWLVRVAIQFFYFDTSSAPQGKWYKAGELALVALFCLFAVTYLTAFALNVWHSR